MEARSRVCVFFLCLQNVKVKAKLEKLKWIFFTIRTKTIDVGFCSTDGIMWITHTLQSVHAAKVVFSFL